MASPTNPEPATLVEGRILKPGHEHDYQVWVQHAIAASERFPGNQGITILAPEEGKPGVRYVVHRFSDEAAEQLWLRSREYDALVKEATTFSTPHIQMMTGMDPWFVLPDQQVPTPPRWKMSLALIPSAYVISTVVVLLLDSIIPHVSFLINNVIVTVLLAFLLTYIGLPISIYLLRPWLYAQKT